MPVTGNISLWADRFPRDQIPKVILLILDSWETFRAPSEMLEVPLTRALCVHLRRSRDRSVHFFRIDWESHVLADGAQQAGRIDLKFSQGLDEDVYFSIECKRLRVQFPTRFDTLARQYVTEGMLRYFTGQYAEDLDKGGMLGYVMDGNVSEAIHDVTEAIERRRFDLYMSENETLRPCAALSSRQVRETSHNYGPGNRFIVYHIFLPIQ